MYEVVLATVAYFSYFLVRGFTQSDLPRAHHNGEKVIAFEQRLGINWEEAIQHAISGHSWLVDVANWTYIYGHWPVIITVGVWLMRSRSDEYRVLRNAFLISGGIGLIIFATFPVAPPRLMDIGLLDTVTERTKAYRVLQPPALVNQYAAMPSLHFGWDLLIGIALVRNARAPVIRVIGVLLPMAMAFAVVATANHFVIDCVAGGSLAVVSLFVATMAAHHFRRFESAAHHRAHQVRPRRRREVS